MYKCKLQELCQRKNWDLPVYSTVKIGPRHLPRYTASVNVKDEVFETPDDYKSVKEAQNSAARIAFDRFYVHPPPRPAVNSPGCIIHLNSNVAKVTPLSRVADVDDSFPISPLPSSLPVPSAGLFAVKNDTVTEPVSREAMNQNDKDASQASLAYGTCVASRDNNYKDSLHVYKNQLQQFAQKQNLGFPLYTCEAEGPPHARRYKSAVSLGGKSYETPEYYTTRKEAEQAAARLASRILSVDVIQEDGGLYKNRLQEVTQRLALPCPSYETVSSGLSHTPIFVSTVEIGNDTFQGTEAKTKKLAEINAAKVAYCALTEGLVKESPQVSPTDGHATVDDMTMNIQHMSMVKQHHDTTHEEIQDTGKTKTAFAPDKNVTEQLVNESNPSSTKTKTVVFPRKLNFQIPECALVMPYSDSRWVAYKVPA